MTIQLVSLGEVAATIMGQAPPGASCNKTGDGTVFVKAGEFAISRPVIREWTTAPKKLAREGDVLVCVVGATAGKINLAIDCAIGRSVAAVRPNRSLLEPSYLYHFLQTRIERLRAASQGLAQGVITREMLHKLLIPLPPLEEQRRIAAMLDKADALRRKRKQALDLLNDLVSACFESSFGYPSHNALCLPVSTIGALMSDVSYGTSAKAGEKGAYPILRMGNLTSDGRMDLSSLKYIDLSGKEVERYTVRKGDILFNRTNSAELVGKTALFNESTPYAYAGYLVRARTKLGISPEYVVAYLNSRHGKAVLRGMAKSIIGMANINAKEMQSIPILVPDSSLQREFSERVRGIARMRDMVESNARTFETLFASLQSRAFSGQL